MSRTTDPRRPAGMIESAEPHQLANLNQRNSLLPWGAAESKRLLARLDERTRTDPLLAHQEGHFKICVLRTALSLDYTVQEPSSRRAVVFEAAPSGSDGSWPTWSEAPRTIRVANGSCDLMLRRGRLHLMVELKCKPDQGSKAQAGMGEMRADLVRTGKDPRFIFLSVLDEKIYRSFSASKTERRGRKSSIPELKAVFPPMKDLPLGEATEVTRSAVGHVLRFWLLRQRVEEPAQLVSAPGKRPLTIERVLVLGRRD